MNHVSCQIHSLAGVTRAESLLASLDGLTLAIGRPQHAIESGTRSVELSTVALHAAESSLRRCLLRCMPRAYMTLQQYLSVSGTPDVESGPLRQHLAFDGGVRQQEDRARYADHGAFDVTGYQRDCRSECSAPIVYTATLSYAFCEPVRGRWMMAGCMQRI